MALKDILLEERARILKELEATENLLVSRFGWTAEDTAKPTSSVPATAKMPIVMPNGKPIAKAETNILGEFFEETPHSTPPIAYAKEAEEWLKEAPQSFTVVDFRRWLHAKYGEDAVNESSVRGPFKTLEESGRIEAIQQGQGRRPTTYRKA